MISIIITTTTITTRRMKASKVFNQPLAFFEKNAVYKRHFLLLFQRHYSSFLFSLYAIKIIAALNRSLA